MLEIKEGNLTLHLECYRDGSCYDDPCLVESGYCIDASGNTRDLTDDELDECCDKYSTDIDQYVTENDHGRDADYYHDMQQDGEFDAQD